MRGVTSEGETGHTLKVGERLAAILDATDEGALDLRIRAVARKVSGATGTKLESERRYIYKLLAGQVRRPSRRKMEPLATALEVPLGDLWQPTTRTSPRDDLDEARRQIDELSKRSPLDDPGLMKALERLAADLRNLQMRLSTVEAHVLPDDVATERRATLDELDRRLPPDPDHRADEGSS